MGNLVSMISLFVYKFTTPKHALPFRFTSVDCFVSIYTYEDIKMSRLIEPLSDLARLESTPSGMDSRVTNHPYNMKTQLNRSSADLNKYVNSATTSHNYEHFMVVASIRNANWHN